MLPAAVRRARGLHCRGSARAFVRRAAKVLTAPAPGAHRRPFATGVSANTIQAEMRVRWRAFPCASAAVRARTRSKGAQRQPRESEEKRERRSMTLP